jgi:hypothetical protein
MLEGFVMELAEINCKIEGFKVLPGDFRGGSGLKRAQTYFKKVAELRFPDQKEWEELLRLFRIRNAIVHAWGRTEEKNCDKLPKVKGFTVSPEGKIWLEAEALPSAVEVVEAFVDRLEKHLGGRQDA